MGLFSTSPPPAPPPTPRGFLRRVWGFLGRVLIYSSPLIILGLVALGLYAHHLDGIVTAKFAGARWALPAQVYSRPFEITPQRNLSPQELEQELVRLGYRNDGVGDTPGTYQLNTQSLLLFTRAVEMGDGIAPHHKVLITFSDKMVSQVTDVTTNNTVQGIRLDPLLLGSIHPGAGEDRMLLRLANVPKLFQQSLILVEDKRFHEHLGISPKGIVRAMIANLKAGRTVQGGSTLTQQLVKNFFLTNERSYRRKFKEMIMAIILDVRFSKEEVLEAYINEVYMGQDGDRAIHGMGLASQFYFNKPLTELQLPEYALLIGMLRGPTEYNPRTRPEKAKFRRDTVLTLLAENNLISAAQLQAAKSQPLAITGRGNRAIDDWCENFIIDGSFEWFWQRFHKTLAPDWFAQYMRIEYGNAWQAPRRIAA